MRHLVEKSGRSGLIMCDSAGTMDMHTGNPPDRRMRQTAKARGIVLDSRAREIHSDDFYTFDLILTMDAKNHSDVMRRFDTLTAPTAKVQMFCDYAHDHDLTEVPDPSDVAAQEPWASLRKGLPTCLTRS